MASSRSTAIRLCHAHQTGSASSAAGMGHPLIPIAPHVDLADSVGDLLLLEQHPNFLAVGAPGGRVTIQCHPHLYRGRKFMRKIRAVMVLDFMEAAAQLQTRHVPRPQSGQTGAVCNLCGPDPPPSSRALIACPIPGPLQSPSISP